MEEHRVAEISKLPRSLAWNILMISRSTGELYVKLLRENCPDEFQMYSHQEGVTKEQFEQLQKLRKLFLPVSKGGEGHSRKKVIQILKREGI